MDIAGELEELQGTMERLEAGEVGVESCFAVHQRLDALRALFREAPEQLEPHLDSLKAISGGFKRYLRDHTAEIADQYHDLGAVIRSLEEEKQYFRELLLREATEREIRAINGHKSRVVIKEINSNKLPPANSPERQRLEGLLKEWGHWGEVSQLSAARLSAAVSRGVFEPREQQELESLLPREPSFLVRSQPSDGS
jgi:hypothetical protein